MNEVVHLLLSVNVKSKIRSTNKSSKPTETLFLLWNSASSRRSKRNKKLPNTSRKSLIRRLKPSQNRSKISSI